MGIYHQSFLPGNSYFYCLSHTFCHYVHCIHFAAQPQFSTCIISSITFQISHCFCCHLGRLIKSVPLLGECCGHAFPLSCPSRPSPQVVILTCRGPLPVRRRCTTVGLRTSAGKLISHVDGNHCALHLQLKWKC